MTGRAYRGATSAAARKVEAALIMLKLPAARPYPDSGLGYMYKRDVIGRFGPRWWAADDTPPATTDDNDNPLLCCDCALPVPLIAPPFITDRDKADRQGGQRTPGQAAGRPGLARRHRHSLGEGASGRSPGSGGAPQRGAGDPIRRHGFRRRPRPPTICCTAASPGTPGPPRRRTGSDALPACRRPAALIPGPAGPFGGARQVDRGGPRGTMDRPRRVVSSCFVSGFIRERRFT